MCHGCWVEYGSPAIINDRVKKIALLAEGVYEHAPTGGCLHIHLDDWNLEDEHFLKFHEDGRDTPPEQLAVQRECFAEMQAATLEERASALALWDKFIDLEGRETRP